MAESVNSTTIMRAAEKPAALVNKEQTTTTKKESNIMEDRANSIKGLSDKDAEKALLAYYLDCHGEESENSLKAALFRVRILRNRIRHLTTTLHAILDKAPGYCTRCGMRYWINEERSGDLETETLKHDKLCPRWDLVSSDSDS